MIVQLLFLPVAAQSWASLAVDTPIYQEYMQAEGITYDIVINGDRMFNETINISDLHISNFYWNSHFMTSLILSCQVKLKLIN